MITSLAGQGFDVQRACTMLGVSVSGYYDWKVRPPSARTLRHAWLAGEIAQVHKDSGGTYGTLRVTAELSIRPRDSSSTTAPSSYQAYCPRLHMRRSPRSPERRWQHRI